MIAAPKPSRGRARRQPSSAHRAQPSGRQGRSCPICFPPQLWRPSVVPGISAGASLAGPDLALFRAPDDPGVVTDAEGLALAPFFPLTHANRGRQEWYAEIIATNRGSRFVTLTDEQAVVIAGDAREVRESLIIDAGSC
jgi:Peptidase family S51